ncbi:MAG: DUF2892 domain-containing protein [Ignavibacteriaceae bacterium]|nr:DUF2892 domain-containing protein [Ignavibacteriaceae bacterium]
MVKNIGSADKIIRVVLGLAIIVTGIAVQSWWGAVGLIPIVTAGVSFCPLYTIVGLTTCKTSK